MSIIELPLKKHLLNLNKTIFFFKKKDFFRRLVWLNQLYSCCWPTKKEPNLTQGVPCVREGSERVWDSYLKFESLEKFLTSDRYFSLAWTVWEAKLRYLRHQRAIVAVLLLNPFGNFLLFIIFLLLFSLFRDWCMLNEWESISWYSYKHFFAQLMGSSWNFNLATVA